MLTHRDVEQRRVHVLARADEHPPHILDGIEAPELDLAGQSDWASGQGAEQRDPEQLLSPEEAKRLLNAVTPEEKELLKARLKTKQRRKAEKDW